MTTSKNEVTYWSAPGLGVDVSREEILCQIIENKLLPETEKKQDVKVTEIINIVCSALGISYADIIGKSRLPPMPDNRKILAACLKTFAGAKWKKSVKVAEVMERDHSTIIFMWKKANDLNQTDPVFRKKLLKCKLLIQNQAK